VLQAPESTLVYSSDSPPFHGSQRLFYANGLDASV
jgi:hypothetical protein